MAVKILTAREAADLVPNNINFAINGFMGASVPEEIAVEIENRFLETGEPNNLTLLFCAAQGDGKTKGLNHLAHEGLIRRAIGGHWGMAPKLGKLVVENKILAYDFPQGVTNHMFRDTAAHKPGTISHVGLGTFVDPRNLGGKLNPLTQKEEDLVKLMEIDGKEYLFYKTHPVNFAILGGTYADENGNISIEREGVRAETLAVAQACKNSGGTVIVQVERVVKAGTLDPQKVEIPGVLVDAVVVISDPRYHMQNFGTQYNPGFSGEHRMGLAEFKPAPLNNKKVIARRAAMELIEGSVVNLGIGIPEFISSVAMEEGISKFSLTVESGLFGGNPQSGLDFGVSLNPDAIISMPSMFDFYQGGGLDQAFLGFAESDKEGNVNVSKFGAKLPGCGGFIDISQNSKQVFFCGTFTANGLKTEIKDGKLHILREGSINKFRESVEHITFSVKTAIKNNLPVMYITERAVFKLTKDGIMLTEVAPGIDLEKDILAHMPMKPLISPDLKPMDVRIFRNEKMGLKK
ncbi:acyl CoA:acetate/3-ketoacid CoA transferase [Caproiciproducens galactitolivorans]|uniref:Acyl CoA:acetate/3-ketoacid CoA transferase n=1 Tax=Caproiciproducens galactitolivorans TaxID=642589 RepID=A0ABT4BTR6_9FIRM|nr:acyl CoA:acetate/3-ketoacid CoA transferase [Caproiciproducens galactitolivorans]MCY1714279.1 acyl CoA:acetate/3-ketoacid CoA transferase [Caproiciproducens galactitolivorans]